MSSEKQKLDDKNQKEIEDQNRLREIFGGSFFLGDSSSGKKGHQSLAVNRWKRAYEFVRRTNEMKRQALTTPLANGARMHGHAFGILSIESELRRSLFDLLYNEYPPLSYIVCLPSVSFCGL
ncbi:hypothetical protein R1sor_010562 [Riccia sorocarpa]|uniref:Uncharacterized protein n=1 Tax=Riccia sorocarpa TaxID=122646 RepID=A0ABD3HZU0_9MARC